MSTIWGKEHSRNTWCFKCNLAASANSSLYFVGTNTRKSAWVKDGNNIDPSSSWYFALSVSLASKMFTSARRQSLHRRRNADQREDKAFTEREMRTSEKTMPSQNEKPNSSFPTLFRKTPATAKMTCQNDLPTDLPPSTYVAFSFDFHLWFAHIFNSSKTQEEFKSSQHCPSNYRYRLVHHHYEVCYLLQHQFDCTTCNHICWISCCVSSKWTKSKAKDVHAHFSDQILKEMYYLILTLLTSNILD